MPSRKTPQLPEVINIAPYHYSLIHDDESYWLKACNDQPEGNTRGFWGLTLVADQVFAISPDLIYEGKLVNTIHESLHVMLSNTGLDLNEEQEEAMTSALAPQFMQFIRANPELIEAIQYD